LLFRKKLSFENLKISENNLIRVKAAKVVGLHTKFQQEMFLYEENKYLKMCSKMFNNRVSSVIFFLFSFFFLVAKICHFPKKKIPKQHGEGNHPLENFQKKW
jgi:hypothetical protein